MPGGKDPCADSGKRARPGDEVWEEPILAQLEALERTSTDGISPGERIASIQTGRKPNRSWVASRAGLSHDRRT